MLDPFAGSGVVPLESAILGRIAWANDLSLYAYTLTRAKLETPDTLQTAIKHAQLLCDAVEARAEQADVSAVPEWIQEFYHPKTLKEIVTAFDLLRERNEYFLMGCLLGIMHHVRPGFLSCPASHLTPYLRKSKFPVDEFPEMYEYRDLRSRLIAKVTRAFKRSMLPQEWKHHKHRVWKENSMALPIKDGTVNAIVSSPPYFGALDYARDNRLRLWFLGCDDWRELDKSLTANKKVYLPQMEKCLIEMSRVLRADSYCVLVLGDVEKDGQLKRTAEILSEMAERVTNGTLKKVGIYDDKIPDERRSRRQTKTTEFERILVMHKGVMRLFSLYLLGAARNR